MQHRLHGLRGKAFVKKYKELYAELSSAIKIDFDLILARDGKFSAIALGELCQKHKIPVTVLDDWLPEITELRYASGTWDRLKFNGVTARDIGVIWTKS